VADRPSMLTITSGGQTGVDRAALDFAIGHRLPHSGWCPKGRLAADGVLPERYQLQETESAGYRQRTKLNVRDSDATLILNVGPLDGGTLQTLRFAHTLKKPHLVLQLDAEDWEHAVQDLRRWLEVAAPSVLNVAGPREEKRPGAYATAMAMLMAAALGGKPS
jgi:hypothetical protein